MNTQSLTPETEAIWNHSHAECMLLNHARKLERERDELLGHLAKCHEAIGESADSDNSELWMYFAGSKARNNALIAAYAEIDKLRAVVLELIKGIADGSLLTPSAPSCDG